MNVFNLFESKDIENIKLGLQVVKTLNKQKEFEEYFKISFNEYEKLFDEIILLNSDKNYSCWITMFVSKNKAVIYRLENVFDGIEIATCLLKNGFNSFTLSSDKIHIHLSDNEELFEYINKGRVAIMKTETVIKRINKYFNKPLKTNKIKTKFINNGSFMDLVSLFESKQIENITLGLELVEYQNCQEQFEEYFKTSFVEYSNVFNNLILKLEKRDNLSDIAKNILYNKCSLKQLNNRDIYHILKDNIELINYFDLNKLETLEISDLLILYPEYIDKFNLDKLCSTHICGIITHYPSFINKMNISIIEPIEAFFVVLKQPTLFKYFDLSTITDFEVETIIGYGLLDEKAIRKLVKKIKNKTLKKI